VFLAGFFSDYSNYKNLFLFTLLAVAAQAFQPIWFFQGIERMKNITIYMVITKVLYALLVILLVRGADDVLLVIFSWAIAQTVGAIISILFVYHEGFSIPFPTIKSVLTTLKNSRHFFVSRIAVAMYTSVNTIALGLVGNTTQLAYYGVCEQLYKAGQNVTMPINQALYPYMSKEKNWPLFFKLVSIVVIILTAVLFFINYFIGDILGLIFGEQFSEAAFIMTILLAMIVVNYIGVAFGYPAFGAMGFPQYANKTVVVGAIIHILMISTLFYMGQINAYFIAITTLITEVVVATLRVSKIIRLL
jgi:PST family polysaccharide transporter